MHHRFALRSPCSRRLDLVAAASFACLAACSASDDTTALKSAAVDAPVPPDPIEADPLGPAYALAVAVWSDSGPTGYVALSDTLDGGDVSLDDALEVPGYPSIQAARGRLLVANDEQLAITRYDVTPELQPVRGDTLSLAASGVRAVLFSNQYWQGDRAAYHELDATDRVIWDPVSFTIDGVLADSALPVRRDGLDLFANFNRTEFVSSGDVVRPFSYHDQDWMAWSPDTQLVVYDAGTHAVKRVIDAPCPGLDSITLDEQGNKYLGTWEYSTLYALMGTGAAPCAVRLTPDNALDPSWNPDLSRLTGGRSVKNFRYLGQGRAVGGVLHVEEYGEAYDFSRLLENTDDFWSSEGRFHRLWMFDLRAESATPVTGIEFEFTQPYFSHAVIDGRFFVFLADGNTNQASRTVAYELQADARATRLFEVTGDVRQWVKIR